MTAYFRDSVRNEEARVKAFRDLNLVDTSPCAMIARPMPAAKLEAWLRPEQLSAVA